MEHNSTPGQIPGTPGAPFPGEGQKPQNGRDFFDTVRALQIPRGRDRWVGGVASGVAHRFGIDPVLVRGAFVVLTLLAGFGLLIYGIAWALLPEPDGRIHVQEAIRGRWSSGMTGALIATIMGMSRAGSGIWDLWWGGLAWIGWVLPTIGVIAGVIWLVKHYGTGDFTARSWPDQPQAPSGNPYTGSVAAEDPRRTTPVPPAASASPAGTSPTFSHPAPAPTAPTAHGSVPPSFIGDQPISGPGVDSTSGLRGQYGPRGHEHWQGHQRNWRAEREQQRQQAKAQMRAAHRTAQLERRANRPKGPGGAMVAVFGGAALLAIGVILLAHVAAGASSLMFGPLGIAAGAAALILGLGVLISGARGRRPGILGAGAVIALLLALNNGPGLGEQGVQGFGSVSVAPTSVSELDQGMNVAMGNSTVDLTGLKSQLPLSSSPTFNVNAAFSNVRITIPDGMKVRLDSDVAFSNVNANGKSQGGLASGNTTTVNPDAPGEPVIIKVHGAFSNVKIINGSAK